MFSLLRAKKGELFYQEHVQHAGPMSQREMQEIAKNGQNWHKLNHVAYNGEGCLKSTDKRAQFCRVLQ